MVKPMVSYIILGLGMMATGACYASVLVLGGSDDMEYELAVLEGGE
jgi:hypothetical protein